MSTKSKPSQRAQAQKRKDAPSTPSPRKIVPVPSASAVKTGTLKTINLLKALILTLGQASSNPSKRRKAKHQPETKDSASDQPMQTEEDTPAQEQEEETDEVETDQEGTINTITINYTNL